MALEIFDTLSGAKRPFEPLEPGKVSMYVCGVTPYDRSHVGHARAYIAFDLVYRYLKYLDYEVKYVRNFTDVDDKIIARANERGVVPMDLAQENIELFYRDMDAMGIARPDVEPRVSTSIEDIIRLVQRLEENGLAYAVDGDVYYKVDAFADYGKLSKRDLEEMRAGARVEVDQRKQNPMDFALWKAAKPGEPKWPSPWGEGRPGWHIECSAMSLTHLGDTFDIHAGGRDLVFPHHENEIAQSEGATGKPFARYWMHNGFVTVDNEKMGKSLGNAFDLGQVFELYEPLVLRYFLGTGCRYRNPINYSEAQLNEAAARLAYFYETLRKVKAFLAEPVDEFTGPLPHAEIVESLERRFREAMDDDFAAVRAMDPIAEAFKALNELADTRKQKKKPAAAAAARKLMAELEKIDQVLNLFGQDPAEYLARHRVKAAKRRGVEVSWIEEQLAARKAARQGRAWEKADEIRDALLAKGVVVMDRPDGGTDWAIDDVEPGAEAAEAPC